MVRWLSRARSVCARANACARCGVTVSVSLALSVQTGRGLDCALLLQAQSWPLGGLRRLSLPVSLFVCLSVSSLPLGGAIRCFSSICSNGRPLPCFGGAVVVRSLCISLCPFLSFRLSVSSSVSSSVSRSFAGSEEAWWEQEHESIDCSQLPAISRFGPGHTARGNPYNGCQKQRKKHDTNPSFLGWPPEGEITFRCASTLEADQRDYHCGQCSTDGGGCANDYAGVGFDTPNTPSFGALPWTSPALRTCRHLLTD